MLYKKTLFERGVVELAYCFHMKRRRKQQALHHYHFECYTSAYFEVYKTNGHESRVGTGIISAAKMIKVAK